MIQKMSIDDPSLSDFKFNNDKLSPRDDTEIKINGRVLNKNDLTEIKLPETLLLTKNNPTSLFQRQNKTSILREAAQRYNSSPKEDLANALNESFKDKRNNFSVPKKYSVINEINEKDNEIKSKPIVDEKEEIKKVNVKKKAFSEDERTRSTTRTLANLAIMKKNFPSVIVLDYHEGTPLEKLLVILEEGRHQIRVRKNASKYKIILALGFIFLEFFFSSVLNFKMDQFAVTQLENIHVYDPILNELGEFNPSKITENWRPEMRILGVIVFNIVVFFFAKLITNALGGSVQSMQKMISGFIIGKNVEDIESCKDESKEFASIGGLLNTFITMCRSGNNPLKR
jgi:hypothetical protein